MHRRLRDLIIGLLVGVLLAGGGLWAATNNTVQEVLNDVWDSSTKTLGMKAASLPLPTGAATEATLASIKDTAGVKKITDALPAGTNFIGRIRATDGTNDETTLFDLDTGAGTQYTHGMNLRRSGAGGSVEMGTAAEPVRTDPTGTTTQPVSGTVTANQGTANVTPWNENVAQFGGSAVVTGTGVGGAGIPRVTISNDSSLAANQSVNVSQINGVTPLMGNGVTGTGSPRVTIASDTTAFTVNVGTFPDNEPFNLAQIGGAAFAQGQRTTANSVSVTPSSDQPAAASCKTTATNLQGVAGAAMTVDATVGGITVMAASTTRCEAVIQNESGGDIRCASGALAPTATVGFLIPVGASLRLSLEGQQLYRCIRTGGTSATVSVLEATT